jgi:amidohydrolase
MAGAQEWNSVVSGKQTHGSRPWQGRGSHRVAAQIVNALQTVVSRQLDITLNPAVVSVGIIKGGVRNNIIPDSVEMIGTIRTFDLSKTADLRRDEAAGAEHRRGERATATFEFAKYFNPVTYNNPELTARVLPACARWRAPAM